MVGAVREATSPISRSSVVAALPFLGLATLVLVLKLPTLDTPAYWDELGWLGQAHWLSLRSLLAAIPGLRPAAAFYGHPPGLHFTLALLWKVSGPSIAVAHLLIACFAAVGIGATFALARLFADGRTGLFAALFLLLSPVYLAQSGFFLADIPVAALGVLAVYLALRDRLVPYLICASYMVLVKETSIAFLVALVVYRSFIATGVTRKTFGEVIRYSIPLGVIGGFLLLQKITTGKWFFIYDFEIQLFDLTADSVWRQFVLITRWIFVDQLRFVFTGLIALDLILNRAARRRPELALFGLIVLLSGYSFSVLYYLPRYLLPVLPFFYIQGAMSLFNLARSERLRLGAGVAAVAALIWSLTVQPFVGNGEVNLSYLRAVRLHQSMIDSLAIAHPDARILTVFPFGRELGSSVLGYVRRPMSATDYTGESDLDRNDLVLTGKPGAGKMAQLRDLVRRRGWRSIRRLEDGPIEAELFSPPTADSARIK